MREVQLPKPFFFEASKRAVLLLHSYTGSTNDMRMLGRFLEGKHYTVYAPHFSGHATMNPEDILEQTPDIWWQDTVRAMNFLKEKGYRKIVVLGFSMGGMFAMKAAEHFPLVGVGTLSSPLFLSDTSAIQAGFLAYTAQVKKIAGLSDEAIYDKLHQNTLMVNQQLKVMTDFLKTIQKELSNIHIPVLICQSGQDELIDSNDAYRLKEALGSQQISFHWYKNSSHVITVGVDRHQLQSDVLNFLNGLQWNEEII